MIGWMYQAKISYYFCFSHICICKEEYKETENAAVTWLIWVRKKYNLCKPWNFMANSFSKLYFWPIKSTKLGPIKKREMTRQN